MASNRNLTGCQRFQSADLPHNWLCVPLGERIALEYGAGLTEEVRKPGPFPVYGSNGVVGSHNVALVKGPGLLVGRKGSVGAVHRTQADFWPIDTVYFVKRLADDHWSYLQVLLEYLDLAKLNAATGVPGLSRRDAYALRGAFPPPPEQAAIARILDAADTAIERTRAALTNAKVLTRGIVQRFLDDGLGRIASADRPGRYLAPGWRLERCQRLLVGEPKNGLSPRTESQPPGFPTFSIAAVRNGRIDLSGEHLKYARIRPEAAAQARVSRGDILVVRGNANPDLVGKCGMISDHPDQCIYPDILKRVRFRGGDDGLIPDFAVLVWNHPVVHNQVLKRAQTSNGTLKINSRDVKQMVLPVPPVQEQSRLVHLNNVAASRVQALEAQAESLQLLKRGLMQALLTGRVRTCAVNTTASVSDNLLASRALNGPAARHAPGVVVR